jgi:hypothetical protein
VCENKQYLRPKLDGIIEFVAYDGFEESQWRCTTSLPLFFFSRMPMLPPRQAEDKRAGKQASLVVGIWPANRCAFSFPFLYCDVFLISATV